MSLFYNTDHRNREGTVKFGLHANIGGNVSFRAPSKAFSLEGYKSAEFNGSSISDRSSAGSIAIHLSISERTVGDERLSAKTGPMNHTPARSTYLCQMGQMQRQSAGFQNNQSYALARQYSKTQPNYYFQPKQMVVPSPGYMNMQPIHVQVPPMIISQPQSLRTQQVFNTPKQHDGWGSIKCMAISAPVQPGIIYPSNFCQVARIPKFPPLVSPRNVSTSFVKYVTSAQNNSYRYTKTPGVSHASCTPLRGSKDAPPGKQLDTQHLLENTSSERNTSLLPPVSEASVHLRTIAPSHKSSVSSQSKKWETPAPKTVSDETPFCNTHSLTNELVRREDRDL